MAHVSTLHTADSVTTTDRSKGQQQTSRLYIQCPFVEKDEAKALGAKWDSSKRSWYAPDTCTYKKLSKWHSAQCKANYATITKRRDRFAHTGQVAFYRTPDSRQYRPWEHTGETEKDYVARHKCGSAYKGGWGGVPDPAQYQQMKAGTWHGMSTAYDTRGD